MSFCSEAELVAVLRDRVPDLWGSEALSEIEIRCHDQARVDLLVKTADARIAVEAKLSHWGRLIAQAYLHRYCADYRYIALPVGALTESTRLEASRFGIGIIVVDDLMAEIVSEPLRCYPKKMPLEDYCEPQPVSGDREEAN